MERLSKIAIYTGIAIACSVFVLFVISTMHYIIHQINNQWDDILPGKSEQELTEIFYETESYKVFNNKYPENGEHFSFYGNGQGNLEVTAMNFESYNTLRLELEYDKKIDSVREYVTCYSSIDDRKLHIGGTLTTQFIEKIDCLNGTGVIDAPSNLTDEKGNSIPIRNGSQATKIDHD